MNDNFNFDFDGFGDGGGGGAGGGGGDQGSYEAPKMGGSDAAFLYVLFTFQFFVCTFGTYMFFAKLFGSKEYKREKKVTAPKLCIQFFLILLNAFWMWHTYKLIALDNEMADKSFDPYRNLGLTMPTNVKEGFGTTEVKKAYRKLARKYHPDK